MQDSSCDHSFYDVSSKLAFSFFNFFFTVSHLVMDRLLTGSMVVHIYSMACKSSTASRSDHSAYILFPQGKCDWRRAWRPPNDDRQPHRPRYLLLQMRDYPWMEIRKCPFRYTPTTDSHRAYRTRRTNSLRSTRRANISLSVISSWTFNRYHAQSPRSYSHLAIL